MTTTAKQWLELIHALPRKNTNGKGSTQGSTKVH